MTATAVASPPAPWPEKTTSPPMAPVETTMFCVPWDQAMGDCRGTSMGATRAYMPSPPFSKDWAWARETWRMVQPSSLA